MVPTEMKACIGAEEKVKGVCAPGPVTVPGGLGMRTWDTFAMPILSPMSVCEDNTYYLSV